MASLFQFSIRSLLVSVAIAAVGIGALLSANGWWEAATWGASLLMLACAIPLILYRRDDGRAFWIGYGVFGGLYLCLLVYSWMPHARGTRNHPLSQTSLITTKLTRLAYDRLLPDSKTARAISGAQAGTAGPAFRFYFGTSSRDGVIAAEASDPAGGMTTILSDSETGPIVVALAAPAMPNPGYVSRDDFTNIAHALWLLAIGAVGGKVCQIIYRTRPAPRA